MHGASGLGSICSTPVTTWFLKISWTTTVRESFCLLGVLSVPSVTPSRRIRSRTGWHHLSFSVSRQLVSGFSTMQLAAVTPSRRTTRKTTREMVSTWGSSELLAATPLRRTSLTRTRALGSSSPFCPRQACTRKTSARTTVLAGPPRTGAPLPPVVCALHKAPSPASRLDPEFLVVKDVLGSPPKWKNLGA